MLNGGHLGSGFKGVTGRGVEKNMETTKGPFKGVIRISRTWGLGSERFSVYGAKGQCKL